VISITIRAAAAGFFLAQIFATEAHANCRTTTFEDVPMTVCEADPTKDDIRLWHTRPDGEVVGTFERLRAMLKEQGSKPGFAMNGGMYHEDRSPVGYFYGDEGEKQRVITSPGPGNFGMLPNGVFCIGDGFAIVIESRRFDAERPACNYATQSGPMLVIAGDLHPRFLPDSTSRFVRNGVGVTADGRVVAAISDRPVTFHRFARFFRENVRAPNALYLDGKVSRLFAPGLDRSDPGFPMGPILGTVVPLD
jgi:uncharacterized protein YigE (DUF2233 family)